MHFPEGRPEAVKLATGAVEKMGDHEVVPNPQNFTVWYVHLSGRDPVLSRKIEELVQHDQAFDEVRCAELYSAYLGSAGLAADAENSEEIDQISAELERTISETTEIIAGAGIESEQFAETLDTARGDLRSANSGEQLKQVVSNLIDQTLRMAEQNRRANERLKQSNMEIAALKVRVA